MGSKDNLSIKIRTRTVSQGAIGVQTKSAISAAARKPGRCDTAPASGSTFCWDFIARLMHDKMIQHLLHTSHTTGKPVDTR